LPGGLTGWMAGWWADWLVGWLVGCLRTCCHRLSAARDDSKGFFLYLSSHTMFNRTDVVRALVESNRTVVGPLLRRPGLLFSNFWAAAAADVFSMCADEDSR
jgi:hypothetical protein